MASPLPYDLLIAGAGIAGLACARAAHEAGLRPLVLDRSHDVGGRCATKRFEGQPVDLGPAFLHGRDPLFLADLDAVDAVPLPGWPVSISGTGTPCQPEAFAPGERRLAYAEGVKAFPRHLARGLDIRLDTRVLALEPGTGTIALRLADGTTLAAPNVVLALPCEETLALLEPVRAAGDELRAARRLLAMLGTQPCLTVVAGYPAGTPEPSWCACYPETSRVLQMIAHDSSKRPHPDFVALVLQAHAGWSRERLDHAPETWVPELLAEAERVVAPWAGKPVFAHPHRWRYSRVDRGTELTRPLSLDFDGGARLGITGELFARGGGAEAAWLAGRAIAARWNLSEDTK